MHDRTPLDRLLTTIAQLVSPFENDPTERTVRAELVRLIQQDAQAVRAFHTLQVSSVVVYLAEGDGYAFHQVLRSWASPQLPAAGDRLVLQPLHKGGPRQDLLVRARSFCEGRNGLDVAVKLFCARLSPTAPT